MDAFRQIFTWPPTTSSVIGLGVLAGLVDYALTGSTVQAVAIAGVFKVVCPESTAAADKVTSILGTIMTSLGKGAAK